MNWKVVVFVWLTMVSPIFYVEFMDWMDRVEDAEREERLECLKHNSAGVCGLGGGYE